MKELTREEVALVGVAASDHDRVLALLDERDALKTRAEKAEGKAALADELQRRWAEADRNDFERAEAAEKEVKLLNETKDWASQRIAVLEREGELKTGDVMALGAQVAELKEIGAAISTAAEEVMAEHDEETTGSTSLDNLLNLILDGVKPEWLAEHDAKVRAQTLEVAGQLRDAVETVEAQEARVRKAAIDTCVQWVDDHFSLNEDDEQTMRDWVADDLEEQKEVA